MQAHRILRLFTGDAFWDQVLLGDYDVLTKATNNANGVPTSVGLPSDWVAYRTDQHDAIELLNGSIGWTYSRSRNYSWDALGAIVNLEIDRRHYADTRARDLLSGAFKTQAAARWGTTNKFVTVQQQSDGAELSSTRKLPFAYAGYFGLTSNDPSNATAANIKSTWLTGAKGSNASGTYFKSDPPDLSASSTFTGNSWMILMEAIDSGLYAEIGQVPGIAGKYNASAGSTTTPGSGTATPTTPLPTGAVKLGVNTGSQIGVYVATLTGSSTRRTRFQWLAGIPMGMWTLPEFDGDGSATEDYMALCDSQQAWFFLIPYGIPNRDLGGASAGGSTGATEYRAWTIALVSKIGTRKGIVWIEPDSIAMVLQQSAAEFDARMALIREFVVKLRNQYYIRNSAGRGSPRRR
jgi:hypothetical protein